jgi:perosamine synthetase
LSGTSAEPENLQTSEGAGLSALKNMDIPFHKAYITDDEISGVLDSLRSGWLTMGPKTVDFETRFGEYIGASHSVSMNSCTACLHLALKAAGLKEGDEVILPSVTFTATAEVVTYFRAVPVLADIRESTMNIDVAEIEKKITPRTKAIIPVHFAGQPCDMDEIMTLARSKGLFVIEDAAHAIPAIYRGRKIGTIGDMTCFSFYATKALTTGEGGMVTTENAGWAERMRILRLHGISKDAWKRYSKEGSWYYEVIEAGYKYNMTDIQAALGLAQLKKTDWMWERRRQIADFYSGALASHKAFSVPVVEKDRESAWHLYVLSLNHGALTIDRDRFISELKERGIMTSVHFIPLYMHPYYEKTYGLKPGMFPVSDRIFGRILSLPVYPGMTPGETARVAEAVIDVADSFRR